MRIINDFGPATSSGSQITGSMSAALKNFHTLSQAAQIANTTIADLQAVTALAGISGVFGAFSGIAGIANLFIPQITNAQILNAVNSLSGQIAKMEADILDSINVSTLKVQNTTYSAFAAGELADLDTLIDYFVAANSGVPNADTKKSADNFSDLKNSQIGDSGVLSAAKTLVNLYAGSGVNETDTWVNVLTAQSYGNCDTIARFTTKLYSYLSKAAVLHSFYKTVDTTGFFDPQTITFAKPYGETKTAPYSTDSTNFGYTPTSYHSDNLSSNGYYNLAKDLTILIGDEEHTANKPVYITMQCNNSCSPVVTDPTGKSVTVTADTTNDTTGGDENNTPEGPFTYYFTIPANTEDNNQFTISYSGSSIPEIINVSMSFYDPGMAEQNAYAINEDVSETFEPLYNRMQTAFQNALKQCVPGGANNFADHVIQGIIDKVTSEQFTNLGPVSSSIRETLASTYPDYDWMVGVTGVYEHQPSLSLLRSDDSDPGNSGYPFNENGSSPGPQFTTWFRNVNFPATKDANQDFKSQGNVIAVALYKRNPTQSTNTAQYLRAFPPKTPLTPEEFNKLLIADKGKSLEVLENDVMATFLNNWFGISAPLGAVKHKNIVSPGIGKLLVPKYNGTWANTYHHNWQDFRFYLDNITNLHAPMGAIFWAQNQDWKGGGKVSKDQYGISNVFISCTDASRLYTSAGNTDLQTTVNDYPLRSGMQGYFLYNQAINLAIFQ